MLSQIQHFICVWTRQLVLAGKEVSRLLMGHLGWAVQAWLCLLRPTHPPAEWTHHDLPGKGIQMSRTFEGPHCEAPGIGSTQGSWQRARQQGIQQPFLTVALVWPLTKNLCS